MASYALTITIFLPLLGGLLILLIPKGNDRRRAGVADDLYLDCLPIRENGRLQEEMNDLSFIDFL